MDPNNKIGPSGFGPANFLALDRAFPYRIDFENDVRATAPAQRVDITDRLDPSLDWDTFQLMEIGFGDTMLQVPAGIQHFQTTVSMTYRGQTFNVEIEVGIRLDSGQVFATFLSIDPRTSLPPDVLTGFLPPEDGTGRGMGHVSYTVRPKNNLTTGTQIRNIALVTFDLGETIATNQIDPHDPSRGTDPNKEASVTIDAVPPTSTVASLPSESAPAFLVTWSGADDPGGSGVAFFDIFVSDNGGLFVPWLTGTQRTQGAFHGVFGHTYAFYSVATDHAGNREATPDQAQTTTVADLPATATHFQVVPSANPVVAGMPFTITVTALDNANNVVPGYTGTVHFSSSDGQAMLPDDYPFTIDDQGIHTFTLTLNMPGAQTVTVADKAVPALAGNAGTVTEFPLPTTGSRPFAITLGPDGKLWFTEFAANLIGQIAPDGTINEFPLPTANSGPEGITLGPDGNLWFAEFNANKIGRITPGGTITEFAIPTPNSGPLGIAVGPDGNMWFTEFNANRIGMITPDGSTINEFSIPTADSGPYGITAGADGNLWFTEFNAGRIGRITPDGSAINEFSLPAANSGPQGITLGPDGNLWFAEFNVNQIGLISPDGSTLTEFPIATLDSGPAAIIVGQDGNLWFTESNANQIGLLTPDGGTLVEFPVPTPGSGPSGIAVGPDGNLWFTENQAGGIGQLQPALAVAPGGSPHRGRGAGARNAVTLPDSDVRGLSNRGMAEALLAASRPALAAPAQPSASVPTGSRDFNRQLPQNAAQLDRAFVAGVGGQQPPAWLRPKPNGPRAVAALRAKAIDSLFGEVSGNLL